MKKVFQNKYLGLICAFAASFSYISATTASADYLSLGNDKLYYESTGAGFPLVLISGGSGMDLRQWDLVAPALAESYQVIRYDPRGLGKSDSPSAKYSDAKDLNDLLNHLKLKKVGLIGLSSSGGFALEFAILYPNQVAGLVVAAPFVPGFEFNDAMMVRLTEIAKTAEQGRDAFLDRMFSDPHFIPAPKNPAIRKFAREVMAYNFDKGADFDPSLPVAMEPPLIEQLSTVSQPTLLLAGELDHAEVLRRNDVFAEQIPMSQIKNIADAGHNAPLENPQAFLMTVKEFLQNISRSQ